MQLKTSLLLAALSMGCAVALAQPTSTTQRSGATIQGQDQGQGHGHAQPPKGQGHEPRRPPAEALAACKSLASGASCSFTAPHGVMSGSCFAPEGRPLACRPARAPGGSTPTGGAGKPKG